MTKLPFMKFYPADWLQDTQVLSLETQGAWIKLLCAAWIAPERGKLCWRLREYESFLNLADEQKAAILTYDLDFVADIELRDEHKNVVSDYEKAQSITIISRRMVREERQRKQELKRKRSYEDKNPTRHRRSSDKNPTPIYQKSEVRSHISEEDKKKKGVSPLPPWLEKSSWEEFREFRKQIGKRLTLKAESLAVAKLSQLREAGQDPRAVIEQSILNGWHGLFPVKPNGAGTPQEPRDLRTPTEKLAAKGSIMPLNRAVEGPRRDFKSK